MARKSWYARNARVPSHPAGMDPFAHLGRKRTRAGARLRRQSVAYNRPGAQIEGSAGGGGTARGDAGYWRRKQAYASRKRQERKTREPRSAPLPARPDDPAKGEGEDDYDAFIRSGAHHGHHRHGRCRGCLRRT